ncbi:alpha/beta hydrolase family protein [Paenibacillus koleovorans]|uniref:alpha/beta hydrolase family protein n=1 Tax=Paenibacillus koleovorans TaxID=121608 RepID=UPI000FDC3B84|nr:alpha/beta hydrolase family protein [Paenibacillus koleovorans]
MNLQNDKIQQWLQLLGQPDNYEYEPQLRLIRQFETADFYGEVYEQANGPGTVQRTLLMLPKTSTPSMPAVVVPFYTPVRMAGYNLDTLEPTHEPNLAMALHLVRRGYAAVIADAFYLTYLNLEQEHADFSKWVLSAEALLRDHPTWTGMGKLVADTQLLVDLLCADPRVDASRIGIAGHSLGGKMALYTGCLDPRIKAILCSDFGMDWERSNWSDPWYWGEKLHQLKAAHMDHAELLRSGGCKPFVLLAGLYDSDEALEYIQRAGYSDPSHYFFLNHASGHHPPMEALDESYDFLQKWI